MSGLQQIDPATLLSRLKDRRGFLRLLGGGFGCIGLGSQLAACSSSDRDPMPPANAVPAASAEYTALKRSSFGPHRDSLAAMQTLGIDAYLERQLDYEAIDDGNLEATIQSLFPLTYQTADQLYPGFPDNIAAVAQQMVSATQYRQIFSERQLFEVMVEFWTDHFNIHLLNGLGPTLKPQDDQQVIRQFALGKFRDLLHASAKSPSMLFYLDNFLNLAAAPNENYARELMELHTLGVNGGYTENDVKEVARCFTGWSIRFPGDASGPVGTFIYQPIIHDDAAKTVLQNNISAGGGQSDGEQVLDLLASHPSTARFIATKLCRRFISDSPATASIDAVSSAFTNSDGDIKETLRALFASNEFRTSSDLKFTRPAEFLAGTIRALAPDTSYPTDNGLLFFFAQNILGQLPYNWPTPDGYPDEQAYWASTGGMLNRWRLSFLSLASLLPEINVFSIDYTAMLGGANTLGGLTDALAETLLMRPLSAVDRDLLVQWLTGEYELEEDAPLPAGTPEQIAPLVAAVLISSPYFQLR